MIEIITKHENGQYRCRIISLKDVFVLYGDEVEIKIGVIVIEAQ